MSSRDNLGGRIFAFPQLKKDSKMSKKKSVEPVFNLTKSFSQFLGKTVKAAYLSVRHPFTFAPHNVGSLVADVREGLKEGWKAYDHERIVTVQSSRMEEDVDSARTAPNPS